MYFLKETTHVARIKQPRRPEKIEHTPNKEAYSVVNPKAETTSPSMVPLVLREAITKPYISPKMYMLLFPKSMPKLVQELASFFLLDEALGGVGGLFLKSKSIKRANTEHQIA